MQLRSMKDSRMKDSRQRSRTERPQTWCYAKQHGIFAEQVWGMKEDGVIISEKYDGKEVAKTYALSLML